MTRWRFAFILVSIIGLKTTEDASIQQRLAPFSVEVLKVHSVKNLTNLSRLMIASNETSLSKDCSSRTYRCCSYLSGSLDSCQIVLINVNFNIYILCFYERVLKCIILISTFTFYMLYVKFKQKLNFTFD